jgi:hypothetical protein
MPPGTSQCHPVHAQQPIYLTGKKAEAAQLHATETLGGRTGIAPTHSQPQQKNGGEWSESCPSAL